MPIGGIIAERRAILDEWRSGPENPASWRKTRSLSSAREASGAVQAPEPARISGRGIVRQTGAGMAFVRVELGEESRATVTDAEGKFVFEGVRSDTAYAKLEGSSGRTQATATARALRAVLREHHG